MSLRISRALFAFFLLTSAEISAAHAQAQEARLRAVTFLRTDIDEARWIKQWIDAVNKDGKGIVQVQLVGGPEVMNPFELGNAVKSGVIDIIQAPPQFYQGLFPAAQAFVVTSKSPAEQRKNGAYDYLNQLFNQMVNAHILVNWGYGSPFHLYLAKSVSPDKIRKLDLSGLKLRTVPTYKPLFDALGATSITMNQSDVYTALERGTVDGYGYIASDLKGQGWHTVTKYRVDPGFYNVINLTIINLPKLQSLTEAQRTYLIKKSAEVEAGYDRAIPQHTADQYELQKAGGIEVIKLPDDMSAKYLETARAAAWADVKQKMPQHFDRLRQLLE